MSRQKDTYYHGTSIDHLVDILQHGVKPIPCIQRLWNDSYPNYTYWWSSKRVSEENDGNDYAFSNACESAATALIFSERSQVIVVEAQFPSTWQEDDTSGVNMEGAIQVYQKAITKKYIKAIHISSSLKMYMPIILRGALNNSSFKEHRVEKKDRRAIQLIDPDAQFSLSEDIPFKRYDINELKLVYEKRLDVILP